MTEMKQYLLDTFSFNSNANIAMLKKIKQLPDPTECIRFFSHLINCQYKWMARVQQQPGAQEMSWWLPNYTIAELETEWLKSVQQWTHYIEAVTEAVLTAEVQFIGFDGSVFAATPMDIALQLNYHSIHHRAQMQTLIRSQGIEPDFIDYIGTKYRKVNG